MIEMVLVIYYTCKMTANVRSINIKNHTYYLFNNIINIKNFDSNLLTKDKKSYKNVDIYYIGYITIKKLMIMILIVQILCI